MFGVLSLPRYARNDICHASVAMAYVASRTTKKPKTFC